MEYHEFRAMNTSILLAAEGSLTALKEGFAATEELVRAYERRFTRFSEDSELSALNRSAGEWFIASPELFEVVSLAAQYYQASGGLFDPGILSALEKAGYDRSMDDILQIDDLQPNGTIQQIETTRGSGAIRETATATRLTEAGKQTPAGFGQVEFDGEHSAIRLPLGLRIDLGGIAKGWIAERAALSLHASAKVCAVNAGGDLFAIGLPEEEDGWRVGLEDPFHPEQDLAVLTVGPGAVATSSVMKRRWLQGKVERHHLIDPRSGLPAERRWASATVITEHAARAEVLAKVLLLAGAHDVEEIQRNNPDTAFILVDNQGKLWGSENSRRYLWRQ